MGIHCPNCNQTEVKEVSAFDPLVCQRCGYEYRLEFTGKIWKEGE